MSILAEFSGINAKIKAMKGKLLSYDDFFMLSQCGSVKEITMKLKDYPHYAEALFNIDEENAHRGVVENNLRVVLIDDVARLYNFIGDYSLKSYIDAFFLGNEIYLIKMMLASIFDERSVIYSIPELSRLFGRKTGLDLQKLSQSQLVMEFIENLKGTVFHSVLSKKYADTPRLFELEVELDIYYYMILWSLQKKHISIKHKIAAESINGTEIDLTNITWIYRLKKYFNINNNTIYTYLIPIHYRLSNEMIHRMVESRSLDELYSEIDASPYADAFKDKERIERGFYIKMNRVYNRAELFHPYSFAGIASYIYKKDMEIKNIVSLIEGIRYGLKSTEIMDFLIPSIEPPYGQKNVI